MIDYILLSRQLQLTYIYSVQRLLSPPSHPPWRHRRKLGNKACARPERVQRSVLIVDVWRSTRASVSCALLCTYIHSIRPTTTILTWRTRRTCRRCACPIVPRHKRPFRHPNGPRRRVAGVLAPKNSRSLDKDHPTVVAEG